jgi:hypothetical protein
MTNKRFAVTYLLICLLILSCSRQEQPPIRPVPFTKAAFEKRAEAAFFSGSAAKELRILRNEIYARHGRIFDSKDLRDFFGTCGWYHPTTKYRDDMLSRPETDMIRRIANCETYLQELDDKEKRRLDSVRVFYKSSPCFDTTIVDFIDYTGDGRKEKCVTTVEKRRDTVLVHYCIIGRKDTLYTKTELASFAPDKDLPYFNVYNNYRTAVRLSSLGASRKVVSPDVKKQYNGGKPYKNYLAKFKGAILVTVTGEIVGCSYFWYAPKKRFETLYCE